MNTKLLSAALLVGVTLIADTQAGNNRGGGSVAAPAIGRSRGGAAYSGARFMPMRNFAGSRIYSAPRFSNGAMRTPAFSQRYYSPNGGATISRQFRPGNFNGVNRSAGFSSGRNQSTANSQHNNFTAGRVRGNNLRPNWRNHVVAQHPANWHRDWDRDHDHFFHGHRFVFIDGFWWGFDFGFSPFWWGGWPYDYYGYDPYGYGYDPGYGYGPGYYDYGSGSYQGQPYDQNGYSSNQDTESSVAAVQDRLSQEGYYRGQIDGVFGPETRRALARYQRSHGLRATGEMTPDTLGAMGLQRVARY